MNEQHKWVSAAAQASILDLSSITGGTVSAWLRNSTTGSLASVPDVINTGNPATQSGGTITGNSDFSMTSSTGELLWPLIAANDSTQQFGVYQWIKRTGTAATQFCWAIDIGTGGASARKVFAFKSGTNMIIRVYNTTSTAARAFTVANSFVNTGQWDLYGWELDLGSGGAEADRCVFTINGVVQSGSFSDVLGTPGSMPTQMATVTGNMTIMSQGNSNFFDGIQSRNFLVFTSGMSGRTNGLLTQSARDSLVTFEAPTA